MSAFNTTALLTAWEEAFAQPPARRAITLLAAARPETPTNQWALLRLGARDGALLDLQDEMFGPGLETTANCPQCGERVELAFSTGQVRARAAGMERLTVKHQGFIVDCRPPNSDDLLKLPQTSVELARVALLERCVERVVHADKEVKLDALPSSALDAIAQAMAEADPQAEVKIDIGCPECGHHWSMDFDISSYLWTELQDWAYRVLRDVHALASAYGWSERDVLMMSPHRRRFYLNMVEG